MFVNLLPKESSRSLFRFICLVGVLSPSLAYAGFEWTPPPTPVQQPAPSAVAPAPQNTLPAGPLTPEPDAASAGLPVPVGNVESTSIQHQTPLVIDNMKPLPVEEKPVAPEVMLPVPEPVARPAPVNVPQPLPTSLPKEPVKALPSDDVVEGFGKDIPLAIALHDIVPTRYAYVFSPRDIAGMKISWRGGKPWQEVLKNSIAPYNLDVSINENQVLIYSKQYAEDELATTRSTQPPVSPVQGSQVSDIPPLDPLPLAVQTPVDAPTLVAKMPVEEARPVMSAMDMKGTRKWEARPGTTLRKTLESWAKDSNVELNWSTAYDYPIDNAFYFDGSFAQAVDALLSTYGGEQPNPKGRLYPNLPEGPSVLMVN